MKEIIFSKGNIFLKLGADSGAAKAELPVAEERIATPTPSLSEEGKVFPAADSSKEGSSFLVAIPSEEEIFSFTLAGKEYRAFDLPEGMEPQSGLSPVGLRESWQVLPEEEYSAASKGAELLNWNREMRYCPKCGGALHRSGEISKKCEKCNAEYFPEVYPCVIVLVTRGEGEKEEALLVHAANFRRPFFGLVAGFVETGETLETAVAREVKEETGLEIEDITYFGSQSWPFPHQMMIGFTARWKSGEVRFADGELTAGGFFRRSDVPALATPPSIARRMIDAWLLRP